MALQLLLIDEDQDNRLILSDVLAESGAQLTMETDPKKTSDLIGRSRFEGIFLNFAMTHLDPEAIARMIRRSDINRTTPIVMIASKQAPDLLKKGFDAGATFFLASPVNRHDVLEVLRKSRGTMMEERRRHKRIPFKADLTCTAGERVIAGHTVDLSESGVAVELAESSEGLEKVRLSFPLTPSHMIEADATVRNPRNFRAGIEFTRISTEERQAIRDHIDAVIRGS
ncbi:MAG TPA: PilZ domain-containing protein [Terriglobales bacterium]|nr:PilZ domain-containing protein [Terriglobales bacterium]